MPRKSAEKDDQVKPGELIGRRVGRGKRAMQRALARPDKHRRDATVDTAKPGVSATDRRAGGEHTARRNSRKRHTGAAVALEDSTTKPSRKSTRRSANRTKGGEVQHLTQTSKTHSPSQRATRRSH